MIIKKLISSISLIFYSILLYSCSSSTFYSNNYLKDFHIENLPRIDSANGKMKDGSVEYTCTKGKYIDYCNEIITYLMSNSDIFYFGYSDRVDISDGGIAGLFQTFSLYPLDGYVVDDEINSFAYSLQSDLNNSGKKEFNQNNLINPISIILSFSSTNKLNLTIKQSGNLSYQWTEKGDTH